MTQIPPVTSLSGQTALSPQDRVLWSRAVELEAAFLSEMLAHAGLGGPTQGFSGGIGEDQFASFLRQEQAAQLAAHGGIGLAESLFHALAEGQNAKP